MISSIKCPQCGRIFVYSFYSKSCVCGWQVSEDTQKGLSEVGKRKNKKKNRKGNKMTHQPVKVTSVGTAGAGRDSWEVEIDKVHNCDKVPKKQKVLIDLFVKRKINALMKKYPSIEWLAYLMGDKEKDPYHVLDIYIPDQEVTATTVDNIQCPEFNELPIIGVIHSHHGMGNGFSGTDHEWINQNHNISLCIAKSGIAGQVRMTTPCGALKIIEADIRVKYPDDEFDFDKWVGEETKKIKTRTYQSNYYNKNQNWVGGWSGGGNRVKGYHKGVPGWWQGNTFYPENPPVPAGERKVPRQSSQSSPDSQEHSSVEMTETSSDDMPTIDENMSLADALNMLSDQGTTVVEPVSVEEEKSDNKDEWNSGLA